MHSECSPRWQNSQVPSLMPGLMTTVSPTATSIRLSAEHFAQLAALGPEIVIFGSGARIRFVKPALLRPLIERRIGVETMDTAAACRTYNVLLAEGRPVVLAALFEPAAVQP